MACKPETLLHRFNLILLGKSGVGKSATGNTIIGREAFNSKKSSTSTTQNVNMENVIVDGVSIDVYDTPGFFNTEMSNEDVMKKCQSLLPLDDSEPTVFLLVIPVCRFTPEDQSSAEEAQKILKERYLHNTWILFTRGDTLEREGQSVDEFIKGTDKLKQVVQRFDNRYHVFNNKTQSPDQVRKLLDKLETSPLNMRGLMKMAWTGKNTSPSCNVVVLGKSGVGRSATGNTVLGQPHFISKRSSKSVPQKTERRNVTIDGLNIEVYDTPGLYSTAVSNEDVIKEYESLLLLLDYQTVPTVFLLVLRPEKLTQEDRSTILDFETLLGDRFLQNTWILFTRGDELESENLTIEAFIEDTEELKSVIRRFKDRHYVFNNKIRNPHQVKKLLQQMQKASLNIKCSLKMAWITFDEQAEMDTFSSSCFPNQEERVIFGGVTLDVYDTPELFNPERSIEDIVENWNRLLQLDPLVLKRAADIRLRQTTPPDPDKDPLNRRIVLLGMSGAGKSATRDTILGEERFRSQLSAFSVTVQCNIGQAVVAGRNVCVVDTPGLFHALFSFEDLAVEMGRSIDLSSPGPHAFLYVHSIRFREIEKKAVQKLEMIFGEEMRKYTVILFTYGDELEGTNVDELIKQNKSLSWLVEQFGGRYHVFNNKDLGNREQVTELLEKIDRMVEQNGGSCYSNELYKDAVMHRKKEKVRKMKEEIERAIKRMEQIEKIKKEIEDLIIMRELIQRKKHERSSNCCIC